MQKVNALSLSWSQITARHRHEIGKHECRKNTMYTGRQSIFQHVYDIRLVRILRMWRVGVALDFDELLGQLRGFRVPVLPRHPLPSYNALAQLVQIYKCF